MKTRSSTTEPHIAAVPACWQREAPSPCLRVELPSGETHLFSYQHFVTASLKRGETGAETVRITFSSHELEVEGRGLRELLLELQDFGVKWIRSTPGRYHELPTGTVGLITSVRLTAAE
jgi:hypothetical protein